MESTLFITRRRRFDEISRLIGSGLKKNGLIEQRKTRFNLSEKDYFVGFSWSYENVSDSVVILLEISKYNKKDIPPKLTKAEIIRHAESFKKYITSELTISEMKIRQARSSEPLSVKYLLGSEAISLSKKDAIRNPFKLSMVPKIRVYYSEKFRSESIQACRMLASRLKNFGVTGKITPISYNEKLPISGDDDAFECVIIPPNIEDRLAKALIEELKERHKGIHVFDFSKSNNEFKFANLAAGLLYNSGSEIWRVSGLAEKNSIYIGIDLGHERKPERSKICMTFIDKNGRELIDRRYIDDSLPLNERQFGQWEIKFTDTLIKRLAKINKENEFENIIIHKDGRILEDYNKLYFALKQKFKSVSLVEVVKSNSAFILDPEPKMGDIFDFESFVLLQTLPFTQLGLCNKPIKIKILKADLDRKFIIDNVFKLSKAFCGDSLYTDKKLPITTHIADKCSSFQIGKTLQSFNIARGSDFNCADKSFCGGTKKKQTK